MAIELTILLWATGLGLLQMLATGLALNSQHGIGYSAGPRDHPAPLTGKAARIRRAFGNFMETFPFLAALVLVGQVLNRHNGFTESGAQLYLAARVAYWPAYVFGIPWVRSIIWVASLAGIGLLLVGVGRP